jgi:hypothetical protein
MNVQNVSKTVLVLLASFFVCAPTWALNVSVLDYQKISDTEGNFVGPLADSDLFGIATTKVGDLDNDGVADIGVGALYDDDGGTDRGAVWILFLNSDGTVKYDQKISDVEGNFTGVLDNYDLFATSLATIGDLDDDGVVDIAVGSIGDSDGGTDMGAAWILFLNSDGTVKAHQKISEGVGGFSGNLDAEDEFGQGVASLGDLDSDGVEDLAVGAWFDDDGGTDRGAVWILFLNTDGTVKSHQKISDTEGNFDGILNNGDRFGFSTGSIGDLDGDGVVDIAVGATDDDGGSGRGAVWILFLNSEGTVKSHQKISDIQGNFEGTLDNSDLFGVSVSSVGDLDGDSVVDIAVGAWGDDDGGSGRGAVWILFMNSDGTVKSHQKTSDTQGNFKGLLGDGDQFSRGLTNLGDMDENGIIDLVAGARGDDDGGTDRGAVYILFLEEHKKAFEPNPANGSVYVDPDTVLGWQVGEGAVSHDVYLGTDYNDVNDADTLSAEFMDNVDVNSFDPCGLELVTTYYWRIDEVNGPNTVKGDVWSFTTWLEPNLIAWWKFDEGEGDTAYDSAGNNDGTLTNGPVWTPSGINGSLSFDDVDDYVEVADDDCLDITDEITLSAWIRPRNTSAVDEQFIVSKWDVSSSYGMRLESANPRFFLMAGSSKIAKTYTDLNTSPDVWAHVVATWDGQTMKAYLNGTVSEQNEPFAGIINISDAPVAIGFNPGYDGGLGGAYFDGMIDDVRIYDRALSPNDISELYLSAMPVNYYYVDGVDGDDLNDGQTPETAFATIQRGIDEANDADRVLVYPAAYAGPVSLEGKAITVQGVVGAGGAAVISAPGNYAVSCFSDEDANSVVKNFIIKDSFVGVFLVDASPTLGHLTVVDNNTGVAAYSDSEPHMSNCIFYNNDEDLFGCQAEYSFARDGITDGLVAHWTFDEGSGTIAYDSAGDNDGTIYGAGWSTGISGGALDFDGDDDRVQVPDSDELTPTEQMTISLWAYNRDMSASASMVNKIASCPGEPASPGNSRSYAMTFLHTGQIRFGAYYTLNDADGIESNRTVPAHEWHHAAATFDEGEAAMYIDGGLDNTAALAFSFILNDAQHLNMGGYWEYCGTDEFYNEFNGQLDDVRIYNRALSAGEVRQVYSKGLGPLFVDAEGGDYHLKSEGWRWAGDGAWMWDDVTSPCIDSGNPGTPLGDEPMSIPRDPDNIYGVNVRVNMGVYGGTSQASMPPHGWALLADLNNDGIVDWLDVGLYTECWLMADYEAAGDLNRDGTVDMGDWALLGQGWMQQTIWR